MTGQVGYYTGLAAEAAVLRTFERDGCRLVAKRWRGEAGEIDLIVRDGTTTCFVEVKASATHAKAAESLRPKQVARIRRAAEEFVAGQADGLATDMRIDLALVDRTGSVEILKGALH
ncbi:MAG: YraN family protein [Pseudomonadota bacterium]